MLRKMVIICAAIAAVIGGAVAGPTAASARGFRGGGGWGRGGGVGVAVSALASASACSAPAPTTAAATMAVMATALAAAGAPTPSTRHMGRGCAASGFAASYCTLMLLRTTISVH